MANPILMPKAGITVESCILTEWKVKVGDSVKVGDVLCTYETDKSSFDLTAEVEGEVLAIFCEEGDEVPVLTNIAVVGNKGEDVSSFAPNGTAPAAAPVAEVKVESAPAAAPAAPVALNPNVKPVTMPKAGITVESCILTKWNVKVGDGVKVGDVMFSYETDKSSFDYQAEVDGEVLAIFCEEGDEVPVLSNVCAVGPHGEDASCYAPGGAPAAPVAEVKAAPVVQAADTNATAPVVDNGRVFASPRAKHLAEKLGVKLSDATATGPNGRIIERDVREASVNPKTAPAEEVKAAPVAAQAAAAPVAAPAADDFKAYKDEKMPNIRKVIAKNMVASLSTMAQLTHTLTFDCTNVMAFRKYLKENAEVLKLPPITLNNIIVYAVSRVLKNHKVLNAHLINGDTMRYFDHVNVGIATDTPKGLLVPTLFGADTMSLSEIAVKSKKLSQDAIDGKLAPEFLTGGTFTVSNLGTLDIEHFTPVINPPQTGILGVNTFETRIRVNKEGEIVPYTAMGLSLTYDHRALDGAPASRFLKELKLYLENFSVNLLADSI